jgi:hypothetical protein
MLNKFEESKFCIDFTNHKVHFYKDQNYLKLKNECLRSGKLFTDPYFKPVSDNIYYTHSIPREVKWMRPSEICSDPKFVVNTANAYDLDQGILGNCWFIAGCAALTYVPQLFRKVVPTVQNFSSQNYCGIFHFRFWIYGFSYNKLIVYISK